MAIASHPPVIARRLGAAVAALVVLALAGCSDNLTDLERAHAQVTAKEKAVSDAEGAFTAASAEFCSASEDYIGALDVYGDVLSDTAPTVGDVRNAGTELAAPRDEAMSAAQAAVDAQHALVTAQQELISAQEALAVAEAGPSGTPSPVDAATPSATPLAPAATVERVQQAEADFASIESGVNDDTPLREAAEPFHAAALALELSWIKLFVDTGCASDEQVQRANEEVVAYTTALQQALADAEYYTGEVDGIYGPLTVQAIEDLQAAHDLPVTGTMDPATANALQADLVERGFTNAQDSLVSTAAVQQTLKLLGLWDEPVDGLWTDELTDAVKELQEMLGVEPTGLVDAETVAAFEAALAEITEPEPPAPSPEPSPEPTSTS